MTLLPSPPLTTGSFLATIFFEDVASADCTAAIASVISQRTFAQKRLVVPVHCAGLSMMGVSLGGIEKNVSPTGGEARGLESLP